MPQNKHYLRVTNKELAVYQAGNMLGKKFVRHLHAFFELQEAQLVWLREQQHDCHLVCVHCDEVGFLQVIEAQLACQIE
jgi:hypothetical protein